MKTDRWRVVPYSQLYGYKVPEISGVYTLLEVKRVRGIPISVDPIYVGQAKNLRRRWRQHLSPHEPNPSLQWLENKVEFWWAAVPEDELDSAEAALIDELRPTANRRRQGVRKAMQAGDCATATMTCRRPGTLATAKRRRTCIAQRKRRTRAAEQRVDGGEPGAAPNMSDE